MNIELFEENDRIVLYTIRIVIRLVNSYKKYDMIG